jgi:hypothetical protein
MLRRSARIGLEVVASLLAGILLLVAFGLWRLSWEEPLRVSFLTPYVAQALQSPSLPYRLHIDDTVLLWEGWGSSISVAATGVAAVDQDGEEIAHVPRVSFRLSARALLHGIIAPISVTVYEPSLVLRRDADGRFSIGRTEEQTDTAVADSIIFPTLFEELLDDPDPALPTGYLTEAAIVDAQIIFIDDKSGLTWRPKDSTIALWRSQSGLVGTISTTIPELGRPATIGADLTYDIATGRIGIEAKFRSVDLAALGLVESDLIQFANADLLLDGAVQTDMSLAGEFGDLKVDMSSGPGRIDLPALYQEPMAIRGASLALRIPAGFDSVILDSMVIELEGPRISLVGDASGLEGGPATLALDATIENIDFATLPGFWPDGYGADARQWVTANMTEGIAERVQALLRLEWPAGFDGEMTVDQFNGTVEGSGMTIHYLKPLPPVRNAIGRGIFDIGRLDVQFEGGNVGDIRVAGGRLLISGIDGAKQRIEVDGTVEASLGAAFELLDHPRFGYITRMGIEKEGATGNTQTNLHFSFPAKKGLDFLDVELSAEADISDANLARVVLGQPFADGQLHLELDKAGFDLTGTGKFADVPLDIEWVERFDESRLERRITASGWATTAQIADIVYDIQAYVTGPVGLGIAYSDYNDGTSELAANVDLVRATASLDMPPYRKSADEPATASFILDLVDDRPTVLRDIRIQASDLSVAGSVAFDGTSGSPSRIELGQLTLGESVLRDVVVAFAGQRTDIVLGGGTLDATAFVGVDEEEDATAAAESSDAGTEAEAPDDAVEEEPLPPFTFQAEGLDRILLGNGRTLEAARVKLHHSDDYWEWIEIDGRLGHDDPNSENTIMVRYVPTTEGTHELAVEAADAGATLAAFGVTDSILGGRLTITGLSRDDEPDRPLRGNLNVSQFRLVNAANLGRLLSMATLTGLVDALTGEGFLFTGLRAEFKKIGDYIELDGARAHGPSLGITADGWIDTRKDRISLEGTLVPAYAFNSILGNIPVIGTLLQGGKGEGLFAATYSATGKLSAPDFTYNPLAALAPGFLRELFEVGERGNALPEGSEPVEPAAPLQPQVPAER